LTCFAIDHLLWGWTAAVNAQPRVAATLSRAAVEASIFALAAADDYDVFEPRWATHKATGGAVLKSVKNVSPPVRAQFELLWKLVVPFGHASVPSVMAPRGTFLDGGEVGVGISFAGQYAGPLHESVLASLADVYAFAAVGAAQAMSITLLPLFTDKSRWQCLYGELMATCETPRPVPKHLRSYASDLGKMREGKGSA